jgi:hypothetical protein
MDLKKDSSVVTSLPSMPHAGKATGGMRLSGAAATPSTAQREIGA